MFFAATATIWLGGAGCLIIGGLYTRRGTTAGAYTALTIGLAGGAGGFLLSKCWEPVIYPWCVKNIPEQLEAFRLTLQHLGEVLPIVNWETAPEQFAMRFPVTSQEIYGITILFAIAGYFTASLFNRKKLFNLDKMLHRNQYADAAEAPVAGTQKRSIFSKLVGITPEYSKGDKMLAWSVFGWTMLGLFIFVLQFGCNTFLGRWSETTWFAWFKYYRLPLDLLYGTVTTVWFSWGGIKDLLQLFKNLGKTKSDAVDNGMVTAQDNENQ